MLGVAAGLEPGAVGVVGLEPVVGVCGGNVVVVVAAFDARVETTAARRLDLRVDEDMS